jgi:hypothetical protein
MTSRLKNIVILGFLLLATVVVVVAYVNFWSEEKAKKIELGLAESTFPFRDYTQAELNEMYPQKNNLLR